MPASGGSPTWIRDNMAPDGVWNTRRLLIFTEYEDTRRWLERQLEAALDDLDRPDERIARFTGATPLGPARGDEARVQRRPDAPIRCAS